MAFCPNCGASAEGAFCPACGTSLGGARPSGNAIPNAAPIAAGAGLTENVAGALCYALTILTGIIFLVVAPYNQNPRIRFHAFQAILFFVGVVVVGVGLMILFLMLPTALKLLFLIPRILLSFFWFGLWIYLMFKTYSGSHVVLPVIGPMAENLANQK